MKHGGRCYNVEKNSGFVVDLGNDGEFHGEAEFFYNNIRVTSYDPNILKMHHNAEKHEYYITKEILEADVLINLPKPKTYRKAGVTIVLKNIIGISSRKEYLPHHTNGALSEGWDEYFQKFFLKRLWNGLEDRQNYHSQTTKNMGGLGYIDRQEKSQVCFCGSQRKINIPKGAGMEMLRLVAQLLI